jgi:hypothetical protein
MSIIYKINKNIYFIKKKNNFINKKNNLSKLFFYFSYLIKKNKNNLNTFLKLKNIKLLSNLKLNNHFLYNFNCDLTNLYYDDLDYFRIDDEVFIHNKNYIIIKFILFLGKYFSKKEVITSYDIRNRFFYKNKSILKILNYFYINNLSLYLKNKYNLLGNYGYKLSIFLLYVKYIKVDTPFKNYKIFDFLDTKINTLYCFNFKKNLFINSLFNSKNYYKLKSSNFLNIRFKNYNKIFNKNYYYINNLKNIKKLFYGNYINLFSLSINNSNEKY